ncbi:MAG: hypothetical protein JWN61_3122 [Pseudonocardiales bacterium]|nr:hypothetical protein [Pseudonocardiales bacterium]
MTTGRHRTVYVSDVDGRLVSAEVFAEDEVDLSTGDTVRTAHAVVERVTGHLTPGVRGSLVDAVRSAPEVQDSDRLWASVPLGDAETLFRFAEVFADVTLHAAGSTALIEATVHEAATHEEAIHATLIREPGAG